jgi:asparagine synthase (glutamine-hydrolysing)
MLRYIGYGADGSKWFASEMKGTKFLIVITILSCHYSTAHTISHVFVIASALATECARFESFPPGHIYTSKSGTFTRWYKPDWMEVSLVVSCNYS